MNIKISFLKNVSNREKNTALDHSDCTTRCQHASNKNSTEVQHRVAELAVWNNYRRFWCASRKQHGDSVCICKCWWIESMRNKKKNEHGGTPNSSLLKTSKQQMQRHCWMLVYWVCSPGDKLLQPQQNMKRPGPSNMLMSISMFVSLSNKELFLLNMSIYCMLIGMESSYRNRSPRSWSVTSQKRGCDMKFRLTLVFIDGHPKVDYCIKYFHFLPLQIYFYFWHLFHLLLLNSKL